MKRPRIVSRAARWLGKSVINYYSDLFVVVAVLAWILVILAMLVMAVYSTIVNADNSIWSDLGVLCAVPLAGGVTTWMLKNKSVWEESIKKGMDAVPDFPEVDEEVCG